MELIWLEKLPTFLVGGCGCTFPFIIFLIIKRNLYHLLFLEMHLFSRTNEFEVFWEFILS